ncbi:MAG: YlbF family regulator [Clostridiales bacterium]|nr:YlbF family regulator [Clostridiales bacterium]
MSMELILEKARELGEMLAESAEFTRMVELEQGAMESADITDLYGEYTDLQEQMEAIALEEGGSAAADDLRREIEEIEERLSSQPELRALEAARSGFNALMAQVNRTLQIALQGEEEEENGCGPAGCAGCQGCGTR